MTEPLDPPEGPYNPTADEHLLDKALEQMITWARGRASVQSVVEAFQRWKELCVEQAIEEHTRSKSG